MNSPWTGNSPGATHNHLNLLADTVVQQLFHRVKPRDELLSHLMKQPSRHPLHQVLVLYPHENVAWVEQPISGTPRDDLQAQHMIIYHRLILCEN